MTLTKCILDAVRAEGYAVQITVTETTHEATATRDGHVWRATADTEHRAVFELAVMLGWDFDE